MEVQAAAVAQWTAADDDKIQEEDRLGDRVRINWRELALLRRPRLGSLTGCPLSPIAHSASDDEDVWKELLIRLIPSVCHSLIAAVGIHFFQQASSIDFVVLCSLRIFDKAGIESTKDKLLTMVAVEFTKTTFILVATFLLDKITRQSLLLVWTFASPTLLKREMRDRQDSGCKCSMRDVVQM
ncbi:Polyol transporter 5 [Morella rubra]|uniref:Polyol transporter 5 n=1 Tax=Morella rubra TaxID=262757 RepID=A0A6A1UQL0_9ROSI|nr:Polyol transporter 5 [Morella rubra]